MAAPSEDQEAKEDNTLTLKKRRVGQPLRYETPQHLTDAINKYFDETNFTEYSVTGLALEIGSKQLLLDYQKRDGYSHVVNQAKLIIEHSYEMDARENGGAFNIFALKQFDWTDKQDIDLNHSGEMKNHLKWEVELVRPEKPAK